MIEKNLMNNILITGGSGLLGSSINFGHKPNRTEVDLLKDGSLQNYIKLNSEIDTIIHAAGLVGGVKQNNDYIYDFFSKNLRMAINVMDTIANNDKIKNATFILSSCIFPENVKYPVDICDLSKGEPHPTNYGYAYAKRMLEVGARALRDQHNKKIKCLIPCNLYGPNDNYSISGGHVIPSLIHKCYIAKQNKTDFIIWGSGNAQREFIFAPDFEKIMKSIYIDNFEIDDMMIISSKSEYTIKEIVDIIVDIFEFKGNVIFDKSKPEGIIRKPTVNHDFLNFLEKTNTKLTPIEDGLRQTIDYFVNNYNTIRK